MASEFRDYADFPRRGLPLRSWPDLTRLMGLSETLSICPTDGISLITDSIEEYSLITDSIDKYSLIC